MNGAVSARREAIRAESRSKLALPLLLSSGLWGVFFLLKREPLILGYLGDMRKDLFGAKLERLEFVAMAATIIFFVRLIDTIIFDVAMSRRRNVVAPQILRQILSIILYFLLFAWSLSELFNYSPWTALTGGALLAAILGLALQDTLGNLFSGIALSMEGGFEAGDVLHSGEFHGVVQSVSWRATRIRGVNNQLIVLPNSVIARERLEVFPRNHL